MQIRSASYNAMQQISAALLSWGLQTSWVIDPLTGDDAGNGTAQAPLKTLAEFNSRMAGNLIQVPATLQLLGDVIDQPLWLSSTRFAAGASLTVSGTVTPSATTATISVVTSLGSSATVQPWQLTTTGINWTLIPIGSRLLLSNGSVGFIRSVIDANNIVCGAFGTITTASVVPVAALTITVQALSRALKPNLNIQALDTGIVLTVRDFSFDPGNLSTVATHQSNILFFGNEFRSSTVAETFSAVGGVLYRSSRHSMATGSPITLFRAACGQLNTFNTLFAGATTGTVGMNTPGHVVFQHTCISQASISVSGGGLLALNTSCNIQHQTVGVIVDTYGFINAGTCIVAGSASISIGIDVRTGWFIWNGTANRPTITGGTSECRVGFVNYTYVQLGSGKTSGLLNAIPPTLQTLINTDANHGPGLAIMGQSG